MHLMVHCMIDFGSNINFLPSNRFSTNDQRLDKRPKSFESISKKNIACQKLGRLSTNAYACVQLTS